MTSIDTAGSQVSESEISATLVSLRERFEDVRRGEIQRVRGRLGNLSPDQTDVIDLASQLLLRFESEARGRSPCPAGALPQTRLRLRA